jgi:D-arabinose 5-phosphate isomerase GutQ
MSEEIEPKPSMPAQSHGRSEMISLPRMTPDDIWARALFVWEVAAKEISRLAASVDKESFARCVEAFATCRGRIVTMGCGTSAAAARKVAHSLSCIERAAFFLSPSDAPHGGLGGYPTC